MAGLDFLQYVFRLKEEDIQKMDSEVPLGEIKLNTYMVPIRIRRADSEDSLMLEEGEI